MKVVKYMRLAVLIAFSGLSVGGAHATSTTKCVQVLPYPSISLTGGASIPVNKGIETSVDVNASGFSSAGIIVSGQTSGVEQSGHWISVFTAFLSDSTIKIKNDNNEEYSVPVYLYPASDSSTDLSWCEKGKCIYRKSWGSSGVTICADSRVKHTDVLISGKILLTNIPPGTYNVLLPVNLLVIQGVWSANTTAYTLNDILNVMSKQYQSYSTKLTTPVMFNIPIHCSFNSDVIIDLGTLTPTESKTGMSQIAYTCTAKTRGVVTVKSITKPNSVVQSNTGITVGLGNSHNTELSINGWPVNDTNKSSNVELETSGTLPVIAKTTPVTKSNLSLITGKVQGSAILEVIYD
ncbi:hypothetical protein LJT66_004411 [Escherichia coli]|nr:hypothetical protein [Escherichia coli]